MTRAQMIWIVIGAMAVVAGGGAYLAYMLWPPDYAAMRKEFAAIVEQAEAQKARAQQIQDRANARVGQVRQAMRTVQEESRLASGLLAQITGSMRQIQAKVDRLGTIANSGQAATLGDGTQRTPEQLQALHQQFQQRLGEVMQLQLTLQGSSQTFSAASQGLQQDSVQFGEAARIAAEKIQGLQTQIDELDALIQGPDSKMPTAKYFPRKLKEQREILANMTEDIDQITGQASAQSSVTTDIPPADPQLQTKVGEAAQLAVLLNRLIPG